MCESIILMHFLSVSGHFYCTDIAYTYIKHQSNADEMNFFENVDRNFNLVGFYSGQRSNFLNGKFV